MPKTLIRPATPEDAVTIVDLVKALAIYEKEPLTSVKITPEDVLRDGFGPQKRFEALIAELDGEPVGFALFFHNYSTWEGRAGLFIEDLFVLERARGHGLGRQMITALAAIADSRGCRRLELNVLDWNPTRDFYHRLGINHLKEWLPYRMTQPAIAALGAEADPAWFPALGKIK
ncbi:GNAT family N-acetyltransferase [uncultured Ferrovibrio sp.]|jgi:Sortase and related acyltransferases|uniref:GNAT family N-acetyltransferase n=1 Tax=uncultured Ferrovibrio sp. TaxID=1576913 RepID=UPI00261EE466|nr:GNAT family N-acetyltransferase [uncultured Ferrovibrio sp.]